MPTISAITPCLWFDTQSEAAAKFYCGIFPNSKINHVTRYAQDTFGKKEDDVLTVEFEINGQPFTALDGGPHFKINEAVSFQIICDTQADVDHFWDRLTEGGDPKAQQCGWLKDKFGVSWQVVPKGFVDMMTQPDKARIKRAFAAMMHMKKLDMTALEKAANG